MTEEVLDHHGFVTPFDGVMVSSVADSFHNLVVLVVMPFIKATLQEPISKVTDVVGGPIVTKGLPIPIV